MCNFKYMDSDSVINDLSTNCRVGNAWFKKSRFQYFRDVDFVCEHACRLDYHNLKHCSKEMKDNPSVVLSAMFLCHGKYEQEFALKFASKQIQDRVKKIQVNFEDISIEQALYAMRVTESKIKRFKELTEQEQGE